MVDRHARSDTTRASHFLLSMADYIEGGALGVEDEVELEMVVQKITDYLAEKVGEHDLSAVLRTVEHTLDVEAPAGHRSPAAHRRPISAMTPGRGAEHRQDKTADRGCDPFYWG
jgi:hypothetical protein